ncbi:MAG TPA: hypothetical protein VM536_14260 [Chloroflexia bacterium]|nr:hypothetical protein [Chloroflexia bacterium]
MERNRNWQGWAAVILAGLALLVALGGRSGADGGGAGWRFHTADTGRGAPPVQVMPAPVAPVAPAPQAAPMQPAPQAVPGQAGPPAGAPSFGGGYWMPAPPPTMHFGPVGPGDYGADSGPLTIQGRMHALLGFPFRFLGALLQLLGLILLAWLFSRLVRGRGMPWASAPGGEAARGPYPPPPPTSPPGTTPLA